LELKIQAEERMRQEKAKQEAANHAQAQQNKEQAEHRARAQQEFNKARAEAAAQYKPPLSQEVPYRPSRQTIYNYKSAILQQLNLQSKADYRKWLIKNHPDKGGNVELAKLVIEEAQRMGW
jgi:hypothetical protein